MLKRILITAVMALASCQSLALSPTPDENAADNAPTEDTHWMETEMNDVRIGMRVPSGWAADIHDGLLLAEHTSPMDTGDVEVAVLIRLFVPPPNSLDISYEEGDNAALSLLHKVVTMPHVIGHNVAVSEPVSFSWDGHDAAYYLLTNHDGVKTIVIAVEAAENRLVVCNIGMPPAEESRVREMLPEVLDGLQINGVEMNGAALDALPDPFIFPVYDSSPDAAPTVVQ